MKPQTGRSDSPDRLKETKRAPFSPWEQCLSLDMSANIPLETDWIEPRIALNAESCL